MIRGQGSGVGLVRGQGREAAERQDGTCSLAFTAGRARTRGFTLIEMMVVLVIIGILAALLLPAIMGAMRNAKRARVLNEIRMLDNALTQFHSKYGVYPPSRIILHEDPVANPYLTSGNAVHLAIEQRTVRVLQKLWPKFNPFSPNSVRLQYYDYNGNGQIDAEVDLNGSECLVFFLGGMPLPLVPDGSGGENLLGLVNPGGSFATVTTRGLDGFSLNPIWPFSRSGTGAAGGEQRAASLFDFQPGRLSDVDLDGFWEYYDPVNKPAEGGPPGTFDPSTQPHPYVYFSAYDGQGYNWTTLPNGNFQVTVDNAWPDPSLTNVVGLLWPLSLNASTTPSLVKWWNEKSYQIMSPGITDGLIGQGTGPNGIAVFNPHSGTETLSAEMEDNITNFSGGAAELRQME